MNAERPRLPHTSAPEALFKKENQAKLKELEDKVERSAMDFCLSIAEIHNYKNGLFWKDRYESFPQYVKARFGYGEQHAYRLAATGVFVTQLIESGKKIPLPQTEIQVRHILNKIPPTRQIQCWEHITQKHETNQRTGQIIEAEVALFRKTLSKQEIKDLKPAQKTKAKKKTGVREIKKMSKDLLERLKKAVSTLPNSADILKGIKKVEDLIG